jgi:hypothetical protein
LHVTSGMIAMRYTLLISGLLLIGGCGDRPDHVAQDDSAGTSVKPSQPAVKDTFVSDTLLRDTSVTPPQLVRRYYDAIQARDYDAAYSLWGQSGQASGKSRAAFSAGFAQTAQVRATVSDSIRVEGAAGSQYATVPVVVDAVLRSGATQHFEGAYTLRRAMVDGATPEQRRWHIYSADLKPR